MNSVELIGVVRRIEKDESDNQYLVLEVNRPYLSNEQSFIYDYFKVYKWGIISFGLFNNVSIGMQIAIRGHLINNLDETIIISETIKVLYYPQKSLV